MKSIPIQLQDHLSGYATTWCYLMKVSPVGKFYGRIIGLSGLDDDVDYDDGQGLLTYRSGNSFMPSQFQSMANFDVDNADVKGWITDGEITEQDILAGIFDFAEVVIYRVNYMDLSQGHEIVAFGTFGETEWNDTSWKCELRSLSQQARTPYGQVYSLTCRNQYGDDKCQKPFEWVTGTITGVGEDAMLEFQADALTGYSAGHFAPGVVEMTGGANNGADMDVYEFFDDGIIRLALRFPLPLEVGDTFRVRVDCDKTFETCRDIKGNVLEFRGEHLTPVADSQLAIPGANIKRQ